MIYKSISFLWIFLLMSCEDAGTHKVREELRKNWEGKDILIKESTSSFCIEYNDDKKCSKYTKFVTSLSKESMNCVVSEESNPDYAAITSDDDTLAIINSEKTLKGDEKQINSEKGNTWLIKDRGYCQNEFAEAQKLAEFWNGKDIIYSNKDERYCLSFEKDKDCIFYNDIVTDVLIFEAKCRFKIWDKGVKAFDNEDKELFSITINRELTAEEVTILTEEAIIEIENRGFCKSNYAPFEENEAE